MSPRIPEPSKRFIRAAARERDDLAVHRRRVEADRDRLLAEVRRADDALSSLDARIGVLNQMLGSGDQASEPSGETPARQTGGPDERPREVTDVPRGRTLSGPAIREVAVQVLLQQPEYIEALHYRRWYELLREAGYAVAGKDPSAVFLTQITRSPVVRKSTESGVYELDRKATLRLQQRLERLNAELKELRSPVSTEPGASEQTRARRRELNLAIGQTERALDEALRVLRRDPPPQARSDAEPVASRR
jgi:hypothetical protein